nr:MAG TPA_asm: hypothetical protein [Caudoviricetes sp.]
MRGLKVQTTIRIPFNQSQMQKCTCDFLHSAVSVKEAV